ncbi:MAG: glycosyltransferase family 39 protein [Gammaproteobacteria bacterium]|nr:glycosyltransferase family 39 protein [Gammaproteobacteria bacterium]MYH85851.1 glycosyltransferase family 39 protein [Gammaproteobacteria bacterium]
MNAYWTASRQLKITLAAISVVWLVIVGDLMITDVWDETNALLLLASEPLASMNVFEAVRAVWLQQLPLDIYRPLGSSLALGLGKLSGGSFLLLRYFNALLMLCSVALLTRALAIRYNLEAGRTVAFFAILLFSASSLITATWFANIFDAACLFFLTLAIRLYVSGNLVACGISFAFAVFCKESHVLALPLFAWLLWEDRQMPESQDRKNRIWLAVSMLGVSAAYWLLRHSFIPIGSDADIHGFDIDVYASSYASFIAGFLAQSSSFAHGSLFFWAGIAAMIALVVLTRSFEPKFTILAILGLCGPVYWGMFGYQGDNIMSHHNFVGRLYLIPFAMTLFVILAKAPRSAVLMVAFFSVWSMGVTWRQHFAFQQTYAEIYHLAESTEGTLFVHYPEKPLEDFRRDLMIGDFPDAAVRINPREGGIDGC